LEILTIVRARTELDQPLLVITITGQSLKSQDTPSSESPFRDTEDLKEQKNRLEAIFHASPMAHWLHYICNWGYTRKPGSLPRCSVTLEEVNYIVLHSSCFAKSQGKKELILPCVTS
jgi:hypothetical protein